jgi:hypothetical protein
MERPHRAFFVHGRLVKVPSPSATSHQLEDTMKQEIQPDRQEQTDEDTVEPLIQPDNEEQPEDNMVISWMKNIWTRIAKNG